MHYTYHITYSCYDQTMTILLNGNRISNSSSLLQYMGEPFFVWCEVLPEILSREVGEEFTLIYTGREEEAEVLRQQCRQVQSCIGFQYQKPVLSEPLQNRMKKLCQLITDSRLPVHQRVLSVAFLGEENVLDKYRDEISGLEVKNLFCRVETRSLEYYRRSDLRKDEIPIYLAPTADDALWMAEDTDAYRYAFFLGRGDRAGFGKVKGNRFVYSFTEETFFEQIFRCLLLFPLQECFCECLELVNKKTAGASNSIHRQLLILKATKPLIQVRAQERIEEGRSVALEMRTLPPGADRPELEFQYQIPGIVKCTSREVIGLKAGKTEVRVYEKGGIDAVRTLPFEVYRRNRITDIVFQEKQMTCGIGDSYSMDWDYYPEDADNVNTIRWTSSNPNAARVDETGKIRIVGAGRCRICCTAENVSEVCELDCRPYAEEIFLPEAVLDGLAMQVGEQYTLRCAVTPENSFDGELLISSSDLLTVNVVGNQLEAVADGTAIITVENESHRIRHDFCVNVGRAAKKKRGIFGLF